MPSLDHPERRGRNKRARLCAAGMPLYGLGHCNTQNHGVFSHVLTFNWQLFGHSGMIEGPCHGGIIGALPTWVLSDIPRGPSSPGGRAPTRPRWRKLTLANPLSNWMGTASNVVGPRMLDSVDDICRPPGVLGRERGFCLESHSHPVWRRDSFLCFEDPV